MLYSTFLDEWIWVLIDSLSCEIEDDVSKGSIILFQCKILDTESEMI